MPALVWVSGRGIVHPTGGYDDFVVDESDEIIEENYTLNRVCHREDGPAVIVHREDGGREEIYARHGKYTRPEGGPAIIRYDDGSETPTLEEWVEDGKVSRADGPATLEWNQGRLERETYILGGKKHRLDGPAIVEYSGGGREWESDPAEDDSPAEGKPLEWWVYGERYTEDEFSRLREALDEDSPFEWARAFAKGSS